MSMVKLINVTNSHSRLVMNQLENTDAELVKVYTAGDITVTSAPNHNEILLINKKRAIKPTEIEEIKHYFLKKLPPGSYEPETISVIEMPDIVEISIQKSLSSQT